MIIMLVLSACTSKVYVENKENALLAIQEERYEEAAAFLTEAFAESEDEEDQALLTNVQTLISGLHALEEGEFAMAIKFAEQLLLDEATLEEMILIQGKAKLIVEEATVLLAKLSDLAEKYEEAASLEEEGHYEEALVLAEELRAADTTHPAIKEIFRQSEQLIETIAAQQPKGEKGSEPSSSSGGATKQEKENQSSSSGATKQEKENQSSSENTTDKENSALSKEEAEKKGCGICRNS